MVRTASSTLAMTIALGGCSSSPLDSTETDLDPGKPASEYGPKCYLELVDEASNAKVVFEDCTASAASTDRASHVYLYFGRLPADAKRMYVSLVVGTTPVAPGVHAAARAGAIETTLSDGRKFSAGDLKNDGSLHLAIEKATAAEGLPNIYYVTGTLESTLVDSQNPSSTFRLRAGINRNFPR